MGGYCGCADLVDLFRHGVVGVPLFIVCARATLSNSREARTSLGPSLVPRLHPQAFYRTVYKSWERAWPGTFRHATCVSAVT